MTYDRSAKTGVLLLFWTFLIVGGCGSTEIDRSVAGDPLPVVVDGTATPEPTATPTPLGTSLPTPTPTPVSVPEKPSDLVAKLVGDADPVFVQLEWSDNSSNEQHFTVERRKLNSAMYDLLAQLPEDSTDYQDANILGGTGFCYRVRAGNSAGQSLPSNEACVGPPAAPSQLAAQVTGATTILLKWVDNADNEDGFVIYVEDNLGAGMGITIMGANRLFYEVADLLPGTQYKFIVFARNIFGNSAPAGPVFATTDGNIIWTEL
jgi:titin